MTEVLGASLPVAWSASRIKRVTSYLNRGSAPDYVDSGPVRVVSQAVNQDAGMDWSRSRFHSFAGDPKNLKGYLHEGDVLVNSTGTGTLGRVGFFTEGPDALPCMVDSHVTIARFFPAEVDPRYAYYWMRSQPFREYVHAALIVGATNQIELNRERLGDAPLPLPPFEEQRRIADFLDAETARIDLLCAHYRQLVQVAAEKVGASLDMRLTEVRNSMPLRYAVRFREGPGIMAADFQDQGTPLIRIGGLRAGEVTLQGCNYVSPDAAAKRWRQFRLRLGDYIISGSATMGEVSVVRDNAVVGAIPYTGLIVLRPARSDVNMRYIAAFLRSSLFLDQINLLKTGAAMQHFGPTHLSQVVVPFPDERVQDVIAETSERERLHNLELARMLDAQVALLNERRQALITAAVTGQFDVTTARGADLS